MQSTVSSRADERPAATLDRAREGVLLNGQRRSIAITEFKAHCLSLLEDIARTGEPLLVTQRGKAIVVTESRLVSTV